MMEVYINSSNQTAKKSTTANFEIWNLFLKITLNFFLVEIHLDLPRFITLVYFFSVKLSLYF